MKKINKSISEDYPPLHLHLEDLESIEEILKEASKSLSIETEDHKFDSIADITSNLKGDRVKELHLNTSSPYITLDFTPSWAKVYVSSSETNGAGVFYKLNQIIESRNRSPKLLYSFYFAFVITGVVSLSNFILSNWTYTLSPLYSSLAVATSAVVLGWAIWIFYTQLNRHTVITLTYRHSEKSFFRRKKDDLILSIISAVIGAILGVAGTLIVNHYQNKPANQTDTNQH